MVQSWTLIILHLLNTLIPKDFAHLISRAVNSSVADTKPPSKWAADALLAPKGRRDGGGFTHISEGAASRAKDTDQGLPDYKPQFQQDIMGSAGMRRGQT